LLEQPPPFDLDESGLLRHNIYLSAREVVVIFEGDQVEWIVDEQLAGQFLHPSWLTPSTRGGHSSMARRGLHASASRGSG
jgi:hypothetical protein